MSRILSLIALALFSFFASSCALFEDAKPEPDNVSPTRTQLIAATGGFICLYRDGANPVDLHFLGGAQTDFILCPSYREDSPPVIMRSSARESLDGRSAGFAVPMENGSQIGVAFKVKGRIDIIDPASLEAVDSVILEQRPETTGDVQFVFYLDSIHAFCAIDTSGNLFAVGKIEGSKRWTKRIIWNGGGKR